MANTFDLEAFRQTYSGGSTTQSPGKSQGSVGNSGEAGSSFDLESFRKQYGGGSAGRSSNGTGFSLEDFREKYKHPVKQEKKQAPQHNWLNSAVKEYNGILDYVKGDNKTSEKTKRYLDLAKDIYDRVSKDETASEESRQKVLSAYEGMLNYLQERSWYDNAREREQAGAELAEAQKALNELTTRRDSLTAQDDYAHAGDKAWEQANGVTALDEKIARQQSVVEALQEKARGLSFNTSEERERKIKDYTEARDRWLEAAANATDEAGQREADRLKEQAETLRQELNALDVRMYNGELDYTDYDRGMDVLGSTAKGIGGSVANAAGTMLDALNESGRERLRNPDIGFLGERTGANAPVQGMEETYARRAEQAEERNLMDEGAERLQTMADSLGESAALELERAKHGLSELGQFGIDMAANALQMGFDIAVGAATGTGALVPMFARTFGDAAREARLAGADINKQLAYGVTKGAIEVATEKIFDGLAGAFGKGVADDVTEAVIRRLSRTDVGRTFLRGVAGAANEGVEEVLSDVLGTFADRIYRDESIRELWQENMETALYDFLLGAAMGSVGSAVSLVNGQNASQNRELRLQDMADEKLTGLDADTSSAQPWVRFGQDLRKEGADPAAYADALRKDAEGFVGPRTQKETAARTAAEKVQARYQAEALAQLRKTTDIHGQASTQNMEVRYRDTTVKFTGFSEQNGKVLADLVIGTVETSVPVSAVPIGAV